MGPTFGIGAVEIAILGGVLLLVVIGVVAVVLVLSRGGNKPGDHP